MNVKKGTEVLSADLAAGTAVLHWPEPTAAYCPFGGVKVATSGATFIAGTTNFSASEVTDTYYDFAMGMPSGPITS